jgi:hypothetical protein
MFNALYREHVEKLQRLVGGEENTKQKKMNEGKLLFSYDSFALDMIEDKNKNK